MQKLAVAEEHKELLLKITHIKEILTETEKIKS